MEVRPAAIWRRIAIGACIAFCAAGCTTIRADVAREESRAIVATDGRLARAFAEPLAAHPGLSGVAILEDGPLAWLSRVALADVAERSIDVQYYIYESDRTGLILLQRLKAAADRGVRVRLLFDDNNNVGRDLQLAGIDRHPRIQIRIFNPLRVRERWARPFQYVFDLERAQRRMHNKIYAVDGVVAIVGGRNIGDNYFNFDRDQPNFRDLDLLVAGPAARDIGRAFDLYWNSEWAYPAQALVEKSPTPEESKRTMAALDAYAAQNDAYQTAYPEAKRDYLQSLLRAHQNLQWARVDVVVDAPAKVAARDEAPRSRVYETLAAEWRAAKREILVETAYLVPRRTLLDLFADARRRGVEVRVLTNSLASTDVAAVHAGYMKRRPELLAMGVELYEFQREPAKRPKPRRVRDGNRIFDGESSEASLHSKAVVFDSRVAWIGSLNLDPRSRGLNTEIGLFVHDAKFAGRLAEIVAANFAPEISWKVEFDGGDPDRGLVWIGRRNGALVRVEQEPDTTWQLRWLVRVLAGIPGLDRLL
jgi:putative cardiolipin synthase